MSLQQQWAATAGMNPVASLPVTSQLHPCHAEAVPIQGNENKQARSTVTNCDTDDVLKLFLVLFLFPSYLHGLSGYPGPFVGKSKTITQYRPS